MNRHQLAELRSLELHKAIAEKLQRNPKLWDVPQHNLNRWQKMKKELPPALLEWKRILTEFSDDAILQLLTAGTEEAKRLRSSSPFPGVLSEDERLAVFHRFDDNNRRAV